ncbi:cytochrome c [Defluviimonas sp. SAOS-178_SWC]|uniref:cytochrome c n=1 Tax=Defluviimonas sp. SAOS-178_SWC TaxID=3121287 RepID=UPI0032221A01
MSVYSVAAASAAALLALGLPVRAQDEALVKRGEYLVNGPAACSNCHATRNPDFTIPAGMEFAGGFHIVDPAFDVYTANITPDTETGIGDWTDDQIIKAIREGVDPEGKVIFPPMPVPTYNNMSDDDVKAIVAYLRTLPAVNHEVGESTWNIPLQAMPPAKGAPAPSADDPVAYGGYLVEAVAHCFECHTPMGPTGPDLARLGAGGMLITLAPGVTATTPNITPDPETGIGGWSDDEIRNAIISGVRPDGGHVSPPMPVQWFANMTQGDLDAVVAFLKTIPAVSNKVERTDFQKANFP